MPNSSNSDFPWEGIIKGSGTGSYIRIPIPNSPNLVIQLSPIKYRGSTSAIFVYERTDKSGKAKILRLDYGDIKGTGDIEYHWNQSGVYEYFKIPNHTKAGNAGALLFKFAKGYKYLGRAFVIGGLALDIYSVAVATNPLRRLSQVGTAWYLASVGATRAGALGAEVGTMIEPGVGTAAGALIFAIVGGAAGYISGEKVGAVVYDWGDAEFRQLFPQDVNSID